MDIAPELLDRIDKLYRESIKADKRIEELLRHKELGTATLAEAKELAKRYGEHLSEAFTIVFGGAELPDGILYFNIAERVVRPFLEENAKIVGAFTEVAISGITKRAGLGLKPVATKGTKDRIDGIINRVTSQPYEEVSWILGEPVIDNSINVVFQTVKANAEFHYNSGLTGHIVRKLAANKCCKWCQQLAGVYEYPGVPSDVYMRHDNCDCTVDYVLNSGEIRNMRKSGNAFVR